MKKRKQIPDLFISTNLDSYTLKGQTYGYTKHPPFGIEDDLMIFLYWQLIENVGKKLSNYEEEE